MVPELIRLNGSGAPRPEEFPRRVYEADCCPVQWARSITNVCRRVDVGFGSRYAFVGEDALVILAWAVLPCRKKNVPISSIRWWRVNARQIIPQAYCFPDSFEEPRIIYGRFYPRDVIASSQLPNDVLRPKIQVLNCWWRYWVFPARIK